MQDDQKIQSIEDLIASSGDKKTKGDESAQSKFASKQSEIKEKEIERSTEKKATQMGISHINLSTFPISPEALSLIKEEDAIKLNAVCFYYDGANIRLGAVYPDKQEIKDLLEKLKEKLHCKGEIYLISKYSLENALKIYKAIPKVSEVIKGVEIKEEDLNKYSEKFTSFNDLQDQINKASVSDMVIMMMASSIKSNASDIHIEGEEKDVRIRFRIDGVLHDTASLGREAWEGFISRFKNAFRC
ncbi:MAG: ATPase, T2SS/T4P/T4SS family [Candidatus Falkowbacteria bacterium]